MDFNDRPGTTRGHDSLRSEHLEKGIRPITACINEVDLRQVGIAGFIGEVSKIDSQTAGILTRIETEGEFVDYFSEPAVLKSHKMISPEKKSYVLSDCNEKDKYSRLMWACTGIAVVGTDEMTGKQISILSHQDPARILDRFRGRFIRDLSADLSKIKKLSKRRSIDAVIFGGRYNPTNIGRVENDYIDAIKLVAAICRKTLGFQPVVLTGPNRSREGETTQIYFDTQNRRLYLYRPSQKYDPETETPSEKDHNTNSAYLPSNIDSESDKWL